MKSNVSTSFVRVLFAIVSLGLASLVRGEDAAAVSPMIGAWRVAGTVERVMIITPEYWVQTSYDQAGRRFVHTFGGTYSAHGEITRGTVQFDSGNPQGVGESFTVDVQSNGAELTIIQEDNSAETWTRIDGGEGALAGVWRISGRHVDGAFTAMPLRARRTLKILSGTRFQWVAMNLETGEFSGTGGGTYTLRDGKYVENIEFFSRDPNRVGASLEFEAEVSGDTWQHRGVSSAGAPIHEVWTRFQPGAAATEG